MSNGTLTLAHHRAEVLPEQHAGCQILPALTEVRLLTYRHPAGQAGLFRSILPFFSRREYPSPLINTTGWEQREPILLRWRRGGDEYGGYDSDQRR